MKPLNYIRIIVLFFTFLVFFGMGRKAFAGGEDFHTPDRPYECELLKPVDLIGWHQVPAEDRLHISELVFKNKAVMQKRPTLLCRDVSGGKVTSEFVVYQWWWKAKK